MSHSAGAVGVAAPVVAGVPKRSEDAVVASEALGELEFDGEISGTVLLQQFPFGGGTREAFRMTIGVQLLERLEARLDGWFAVFNLAKRKLVPAHVIRRHTSYSVDDISFFISFDDDA